MPPMIPADEAPQGGMVPAESQSGGMIPAELPGLLDQVEPRYSRPLLNMLKLGGKVNDLVEPYYDKVGGVPRAEIFHGLNEMTGKQFITPEQLDHVYSSFRAKAPPADKMLEQGGMPKYPLSDVLPFFADPGTDHPDFLPEKGGALDFTGRGALGWGIDQGTNLLNLLPLIGKNKGSIGPMGTSKALADTMYEHGVRDVMGGTLRKGKDMDEAVGNMHKLGVWGRLSTWGRAAEKNAGVMRDEFEAIRDASPHIDPRPALQGTRDEMALLAAQNKVPAPPAGRPTVVQAKIAPLGSPTLSPGQVIPPPPVKSLFEQWLDNDYLSKPKVSPEEFDGWKQANANHSPKAAPIPPDLQGALGDDLREAQYKHIAKTQSQKIADQARGLNSAVGTFLDNETALNTARGGSRMLNPTRTGFLNMMLHHPATQTTFGHLWGQGPVRSRTLNFFGDSLAKEWALKHAYKTDTEGADE